ncbi:putative membrane protein [Planomicrobium koreense]|uniref:Putative membrane protein n=1 Tax=Planococcus koreensis TaxID=112331 RepID=A0A7W8CR27_9BACL|nr:hypothetical protein [Planococcus koreensis]MBB5179998.1 putative membrane protein [Planococcus koreensis]
MDNKTKMMKWLKEPIFSEKIDPFIKFVLVFSGAMAGALVYPQTDMPFWQFLLWMIPLVIVLVFIIKVLGTVWRNNRKQHDMK